MCKENFVDLCSAPVQGQYDMPAVETSEAGWGGYTRLV